MVGSIVFATYTVSAVGNAFLASDGETVMLPALENKNHSEEESNNSSTSHVRKGKGSHAFTVIKRLISDKENWFPITDSDGYNFPGVFDFPYPQRLGFCEDISKLPNYEKADPHFIFSDIQLGKGRHDQNVL